MNYLTQNAKIKKSKHRTFNWGIPAYMSQDGTKTCPSARDCVKGCYARQGAYIWGNVKPAFERRLELSRSPDFVPTLVSEIRRRKIERVRIHDSGDFYCTEYILNWCRIARDNPDVVFYGYTKQVREIKYLQCKGVIPDNMKLIYSYGGTDDHLIDPEHDRHSKVFATREDLEADPLGYIDATDQDDLALTDNKRVGLVYHGAKSKNWGN